MLLKCWTQYVSKFGKLSKFWTGKVSFHSNPKERQCQRMSNYCTIVLISHAGKVMLKILQAKLQQYVNWELPDVQAQSKRGRGTRDQIANICWIMEKASEFQKRLCFIDYAKSLTLWITTNCGKFWKKWKYQTSWPASWEIYMQVRKQQSLCSDPCKDTPWWLRQ